MYIYILQHIVRLYLYRIRVNKCSQPRAPSLRILYIPLANSMWILCIPTTFWSKSQLRRDQILVSDFLIIFSQPIFLPAYFPECSTVPPHPGSPKNPWQPCPKSLRHTWPLSRNPSERPWRGSRGRSVPQSSWRPTCTCPMATRRWNKNVYARALVNMIA